MTALNLHLTPRSLFFLASIIAVCTAWHFLGWRLAEALWSSAFDARKAFDLSLTLQSMIFLLVLPIVIALIISWSLGLWKGISLLGAGLLLAICFVVPFFVDSILQLFAGPPQIVQLKIGLAK